MPIVDTNLPETLPVWESNLLWGFGGIAAGIVVTVIASMRHDLRPLLYVAWIFFVPALWKLSSICTRKFARVSVFVTTTIVMSAVLIWLNWWLKPIPASNEAVTSVPVSILPDAPPRDGLLALLNKGDSIESDCKGLDETALADLPMVATMDTWGKSVLASLPEQYVTAWGNLSIETGAPLKTKLRVRDYCEDFQRQLDILSRMIHGKYNGQKKEVNPSKTLSTTGSNSPTDGSINQGQGSIAQLGGVGNEATVNNNFKTPPRTITDADRGRAVDILTRSPSTIVIYGTISNNEAQQLAYDLFGIFKKAGWNMGDNTVNGFVTTGPPIKDGIIVFVHGTPVTEEEGTRQVPFAGEDDPLKLINEALQATKVKFSMEARMETKENTYDLLVYANPDD